MSQIQKVYKTTDGEIHNTEKEASNYQAELELAFFLEKEFTYSYDNCLDTEQLVHALLGKTKKGKERYKTMMDMIKKALE